ncbi:MAG: DNA methyltransferase [Chloroflexota bacterium]|nr:DNA methyltransferase [Chloroflexota bacterium]
MPHTPTRIIYYGDNLEILRQFIPAESVDLVYLDPPFKSQQEYNVLFRTVKGEPSPAQVRAFSDTWRWDTAAKQTYENLVQDRKVPGQVAKMVQAFYQFLGPSEMLAYLVMMTPRLLELHRVLKPTGSLYLHCDPAASHYLKIVLDTIFGPENFRNEIVWKRIFSHKAKKYAPVHDIILYYTNSDTYTWNLLYHSYSEEYLEKFYKFQDEKGRFRLITITGPGVSRGDSGKPWRGVDPSSVGRHWAIPQSLIVQLAGPEHAGRMTTQEKLDLLDEHGYIYWPPKGRVPALKHYLDPTSGVPLQDLWTDIHPVTPHAKERLGYQTQKPLALLRRIIQASSNPGDLVLDPFCGCGTALVAAEELGRSWIGIDITYLAVDVMARRLRDHFPGIQFDIRGQPRDVEGARALAEKDRFQFQVWAVAQIGAQPLDPDRPGADRGIDGYLPFRLWGDKVERAIVQVKSGRVGVKDVRDLRGTLEREKAPFAILVTLEPPTSEMRKEAVEAGFYAPPATQERIPRLQILTIEEILQGARPKVPTLPASPVAKAPRLRRREGQQMPLPPSQDTP